MLLTIYDKLENNTKLSNRIYSQNNAEGDNQFFKRLRQLDQRRINIGARILLRVRMKYRGNLVYRPEADKFIESPNAYWAIFFKTQSPSFNLIVFGNPNVHRPTPTIELRPYMGSYSFFSIDSMYQISDTVRTIFAAKQIKNQNKTLSYHYP